MTDQDFITYWFLIAPAEIIVGMACLYLQYKYPNSNSSRYPDAAGFTFGLLFINMGILLIGDGNNIQPRVPIFGVSFISTGILFISFSLFLKKKNLLKNGLYNIYLSGGINILLGTVILLAAYRLIG